MPHLGDALEEAEANDCAADCAADDATCCVPVRRAAGSAAATAGKKIPSDGSGLSPLGNWERVVDFARGRDG